MSNNGEGLVTTKVTTLEQYYDEMTVGHLWQSFSWTGHDPEKVDDYNWELLITPAGDYYHKNQKLPSFKQVVGAWIHLFQELERKIKRTFVLKQKLEDKRYRKSLPNLEVGSNKKEYLALYLVSNCALCCLIFDRFFHAI